jgi:hypothetical protein
MLYGRTQMLLEQEMAVRSQINKICWNITLSRIAEALKKRAAPP